MERASAPETTKQILKTKNANQSPFSKNSLMEKDAEELKEVLQKFLPLVRRSKARKKPRLQNAADLLTSDSEIKADSEVDEIKKSRQELLRGINGYLSGVEKNKVVSVILCGNIEPKFMLQKLVDVAEEHKIPVIVFPGLRAITKSLIGYPSSAISITVDGAGNADGTFYELHMKILSLCEASKHNEGDTSQNITEESIPPVQLETKMGKIALHKIARPYRRIFQRSIRLISNKRKMVSRKWNCN